MNKNYVLYNNKLKIIKTILEGYLNKFYILMGEPELKISGKTIQISIDWFQGINPLNVDLNKFILPTHPAAISASDPKLGEEQESKNKITRLKKKARKSNKKINSVHSYLPLFTNAHKKHLAFIFSHIFQVNVILIFIKNNFFYSNAKILGQILGLNSHKLSYGKIKKVLMRKIVINDSSSFAEQGLVYNTNKKSSAISTLAGFKVRIAGRIARQRIIPRKTVWTFFKGVTMSNKFVPANNKFKLNNGDKFNWQGKNRKGAYSITIWLNHSLAKK